MPIRQSILTEYATRAPLRKSAAMVEEARATNKQTAFLSHSHHDANLVKGLQGYLRSEGKWDIYIDWEDTSMPASPTPETARRIQKRIRELDWFLFLATANSLASRWCPWELGHASGVKRHEAILVIPTIDDLGRYHGNEYVALYRHIDFATQGILGAFRPDNTGIALQELSNP